MRALSPSLAFLVLVGCGGGKDDAAEGTAAGDCSDAADNDADGLFDCDDDGCAGSPDCEGSDENAAPSGAAIAIEPAAPADADDLRCVIVTEATDPNGDAITYAYAWSKNGADAGIAADTVSEALTTGGDTWTCTVTPTDGALSGAPASATVTIAQGNRAPSAPTVSISPAEPTDDDVLTCVIDTESVDPDGDAVTYAYAWSVDGADAGITSASVNAALTEVGQQWTCAVNASDGELESGAASVSVEITTRCSLGATADCPAADCADVAASGMTSSGMYWIETDAGVAEQTACDLSTDGGGWTAMFLAETTDYASTSIDYTLDAPDLLSDATHVLMGFVDASGAGTTDWAIFPMPSDWKTASPMSYTSGTDSVSATFDDGTTAMRTLYYGYWNFYGECGYWQDPSEAVTQGRVGFCDPGGPLFTSFSYDGVSDACNAWAGSWGGTACTTSRRFAIFVR